MTDEEIERVANRVAELLAKRIETPALPLLLSRKQAAAYVGLCVTSFDVASRKHRFPGPVKPTDGDPYWKRADLEKWAERTLG